MRFLQILPTFFASLTLAGISVAGLPVIDDPLFESIPVEGQPPLLIPKVNPVFPTAKTLLFPVSASDDAGQLTITATSSNPNVFVRVKTGNPLMKFVFTHESDGTDDDPAYTDTMVFQLFRDLAPETVGYIGGFAQGGFYDAAGTEHGRIFRIADFGGSTDPLGSFIFQGGSPTGIARGGIGFTYDNEFHPAAIFSGRGQLAMANSGYDDNNFTFTGAGFVEQNTYRGSNGSQFFITDGHTRELDFKHTVFAQLVHGFKGLKDLRGTKRYSTAGTIPAGGSEPTDPDFQRVDQPVKPVKITSSSVIPQYEVGGRVYTDAVLVISGIAPGAATITVTATNAQGLSATQTITVAAQDEPRSLNSRPFVTRMPDAAVPKKTQVNLPFSVVDLERDYGFLSNILGGNLLPGDSSGSDPKGFSGLLGRNLLGVVGNPNFKPTLTSTTTVPYEGPLFPAVSVTQFEMTYRGSIDGGSREVDNYSAATVAIGDRQVTSLPVQISSTPGVAVSGAVARYRDQDPHAQATDFTASINWGDGTALQTSSPGVDASEPSSTSFRVPGTHSYARPGTYNVNTTLTSSKGQRVILRNLAVIAPTAFHAEGETLVLPGPTIANRVLAVVTDALSDGRADAYTATVDWGDGTVTSGTLRPAGTGRFSVVGKHSYRDAENFSAFVRVHKIGSPASDDALAWPLIALTGFRGKQHLPPFDQAHLIAEITSVPMDLKTPSGATKPTKYTAGDAGFAQTYLTYSLVILNAGNKASKPGKVRFYLSLDKTVNLTAVTANGVTNPADIPLKINDLHSNEFFLPTLGAGQSIRYYFDKSKFADYRLVPPFGETASGYNLLAQLDYSDPVADHEPIDKNVVSGSINGILVSPTTISTRESGTTGVFNVRLDKAPTKDVTIPIAVDSSGSTEGTLIFPDPTKQSLTFTPDNWMTVQSVTVKGKSDTPAGGGGNDGSKSYKVVLSPATSLDPFFTGMKGPDVTVSNADRDANVTVSPSTVVTTEADGPRHTAQVNITLKREPTSPVTFQVRVSDGAEGQITTPGGTIFSDPTTTDPNVYVLITFLPRDPTKTPPYVSTKSFTITGLQDNVVDGNKNYTVKFGPTQSDDPEFQGLIPAPVNVTNQDSGVTPPPAAQ